MFSDHQASSGYVRGVKLLLLSRLIVVMLSCCVIIISAAGKASFPFMPLPVFAILSGMLFLNFLYYLIIDSCAQKMSLFILLQLIIDVAAESALVFFSGGVYSHYVYLFFASIMGASMLLNRRISSIFACLATVGLALVTTLHLIGVGPPEYLSADVVVANDIARMLSIVTAFFLVAYLAGLLQSRLVLARIMNDEILQNMPEGVVVFDVDEKAVFFNDEFCRLFTQDTKIPQLGENIDDIFRTEDMRYLRAILREGKSWRFELEECSEERQRPPLEIRIASIGESEKKRGLVAIFIDLSLRQRVIQAEKRAERFAAIGEMSAGLAHELRNPLASVRGSIQEIATEFPPQSPNRTLCDIVLKESDRLERIISDFLHFARVRNLYVGKVNLLGVVEEVKVLLNHHKEAQGIKINLDAKSDNFDIRGDGEQLKQVFLNLGLNACNVMKGQGELRIEVAQQEQVADADFTGNYNNNGVVVVFQDTGPGLAPGAEEKIFEPFYTTRSQGTGLGLAIALRIVQLHNGRLWVESEHGKGATFYCWLPVHGPHLNSKEQKRKTKILLRD